MRGKTMLGLILLSVASVSVVTADDVDDHADHVAAVEQARRHLLASRMTVVARAASDIETPAGRVEIEHVARALSAIADAARAPRRPERESTPREARTWSPSVRCSCAR